MIEDLDGYSNRFWKDIWLPFNIVKSLFNARNSTLPTGFNFGKMNNSDAKRFYAVCKEDRLNFFDTVEHVIFCRGNRKAIIRNTKRALLRILLMNGSDSNIKIKVPFRPVYMRIENGSLSIEWRDIEDIDEMFSVMINALAIYDFTTGIFIDALARRGLARFERSEMLIKLHKLIAME